LNDFDVSEFSYIFVLLKNRRLNMSVAIIEVPFQADLLQQVDSFVDEKVCSRADIILEATKMYIARKQNWQNIFSIGNRLALENRLSEADVMNEIKAYRREK